MNRRKFLSSSAMVAGAAAIPSIPFSEPEVPFVAATKTISAADWSAHQYMAWVKTSIRDGKFVVEMIDYEPRP